LYWIYKNHHVLPSVFFSLSENEQIILRGFFLKEVEETKEEAKKIKELTEPGKG